MPTKSPDAESFYARTPYAEAFDIGYPQENLEGEMHQYRCRHCKRLTTEINGRLENHAVQCEYRLARMHAATAVDNPSPAGESNAKT